MSKEPLVSVLTPSFQQGAWISDNLRSVAAQTYEHVEHVVMDGGSNDGTREILDRISDPRVRWRSEPDRGQSHALNKALAMSQGEIVGWLNSDDAYFGPTVIEGAVEAFQRRPDVAVAYGHAALVNANGLVLQLIWVPPFSRRLLMLHDFISQPAAFIRRSALSEVLADESFDFAMDYELWLRLAQKSPFARVDRIMAIDRHHSARKSTRMLRTLEGDLERLRARYGVHSGPAFDVARRAWKIANRLIGMTLIPDAMAQPMAFDGHVDSRAAILRRQIAMRRRSMPIGDGGPEDSEGLAGG
jgi:glycosyltransferase involved in cell wall biosynthesis